MVGALLIAGGLAVGVASGVRAAAAQDAPRRKSTPGVAARGPLPPGAEPAAPHATSSAARAAAPAAASSVASSAAPSSARLALLRDSVRTVLERGLAARAFPGAYAAVGDAHGILAQAGVGHLDWAPSPAPDENTIWDLASLTKVVGTTTAVMQLWEKGALDLDAPVARYVPEFVGAHKAQVTVRELLTHSSGLPGWRPLYEEATSPAAILALVYATPLDTLPGVRMEYSDLGAILLGKIVERVSGEPLDRYLASHVFGPLGMRSTMYRPPRALLPRIAPTEREAWRGGTGLVRGTVHDENAYALGGVSGHAGLFSSAHDLARFARMLLDGGMLDGARIVRAATIDTFTRVQNAALSNRALGWEMATGTNSAGHRMSPRAFGHTGFTGTSLWVDPDRGLFVLLLTNRVDPTRTNHRISAVRVSLADAATAAFDAAHLARSFAPHPASASHTPPPSPPPHAGVP